MLLIGVTGWIVRLGFQLLQLQSATPMGIIKTLVSWAIGVVMVALFVRVIGQWIGLSPYSRGFRLVHRLTDWIILPIRRRLPSFGPIDASPIVAYLALILLRELVWALPGGR